MLVRHLLLLAHPRICIPASYLQPSTGKKKNVHTSYRVVGLHLHQYSISNMNRSSRPFTFTSPSTCLIRYSSTFDQILFNGSVSWKGHRWSTVFWAVEANVRPVNEQQRSESHLKTTFYHKQFSKFIKVIETMFNYINWRIIRLNSDKKILIDMPDTLTLCLKCIARKTLWKKISKAELLHMRPLNRTVLLTKINKNVLLVIKPLRRFSSPINTEK